MVQGNGSRFALESCAEHFQATLIARVHPAGCARAEHATHAARAEDGLDLIRTQASAGEDRGRAGNPIDAELAADQEPSSSTRFAATSIAGASRKPLAALECASSDSTSR